MLRLLNRTIEVYVGADVIQIGSGKMPKTARWLSRPGHAASQDGGGLLLRDPEPLRRLPELLDSFGQRAPRVRLVVGCSIARHAVLPWQAEVVPAKHDGDLVRSYMEEVFGDEMKDWTITTSKRKYGVPRLCCAIRAKVAVEAEACLVERRGHLLSVVTTVAAAWESHAREAASDAVPIVLIEAPMVVCMTAGLRGPERLTYTWIDTAGHRTVRQLLQRHAGLCGRQSFDHAIVVRRPPDSPLTIVASRDPIDQIEVSTDRDLTPELTLDGNV